MRLSPATAGHRARPPAVLPSVPGSGSDRKPATRRQATDAEQPPAAIARGIRLLALDVDGVLTDGGIVLDATGGELKRFDVQDGLAIGLAKAAGIQIAVISGRASPAVRRRCAELRVDVLRESVTDKAAALRSVLSENGIASAETAVIGDDLPDVPAMRLAGIAIAVANARDEVKAAAVYVTRAPGGSGAVREAVEWLLDLRGQKDALFNRYLA